MRASEAPGGLALAGRQRLTRAAWLALAGLVLALMISGTPAYFDLLRTPCSGEGCAYFQLPEASAAALAQAGMAPPAYAGYLIGLTGTTLAVVWALAAILFWRSTTQWMAVYLSFGLLAISPTFFAVLAIALVQQSPGWRWPVGLLQGLGIWVVLTFGFLFPSGHFVPAWTRPAAYGLAASATAMLVFSSLEGVLQADQPAGQAWLVVLLASMLGSAAAQVYRYRRVSGPVERQQAKWVVFGFVLFIGDALLFMLAGLLPVFHRPGLANAFYYLIGGTINVLIFLVLLACVALSILRYRLWDIDVLIRRTLIYSVLTAVLGLAYLGSVLVLQPVLAGLTGQGTELANVLSTLAVAALFGPVRGRVQRAIDKRFYRKKYDAARVLAAFGGNLRDETDLGTLAARLEAVVDETMQPASVGLWLRADRR
jgi:hypothetical protein